MSEHVVALFYPNIVVGWKDGEPVMARPVEYAGVAGLIQNLEGSWELGTVTVHVENDAGEIIRGPYNLTEHVQRRLDHERKHLATYKALQGRPPV